MARSFQFPKTLSDLSSSYEASAIVSSYLRDSDPGEKIDYSDFSNHVFFNSAYNKYSIFLYKLYNFYDRTFSWEKYHEWYDDLSPYEKYCLQQFPSYRGYFQNTGSDANTYIEGKDYENKMSLTSSDRALSIEFCCSLSASANTGSNANQYIIQRGEADKYYEVFLSSSNEMVFRVQSGATIFSASCEFSNSYCGAGHHFAFCWSSSSAQTDIYLDGVFVNSQSALSFDSLVLETGSVYIGCSSSQPPPGPPKNYYLTGSVDELRVWNSYRNSEQIYEYYDRHLRSEPELIFYLKFNEPHYTMSNGAFYDKVLDYSKRPIDCQIINYFSSSKQPGVLLDSTGSNIITDDYYDPMIFEDHSDVTYFIQTIWNTASEYDKSNRNIITDLVPYSYIEEETINGTYNLINMLYVFARQLDEMKIHINGLKSFWKRSYDDYNVIPYNLLKEAIELFGFSSFDSFPLATIDSFSKNYNINETNILAIKEVNELFWRNLLANIIYIYKTKGTKESIKSFFHCLGIDENVISIKDYSSQYSYPISQSYVNKYKYQKVLDFMSQTNTGSYVLVSSSQLPYSLTGSITIETLCSFKPYTSYESGTFYETIVTSQPYVTTGSIWGINHSNDPITGSGEIGLFYTREATSSYGNVYLITSGNYEEVTTRLSAVNVPIFDGNYYNISYRRDTDGVPIIVGPTSIMSTSHYLDIKKLESDYIENIYSGYCSFITESNALGQKLIFGAFTGNHIYQNVDTETRQTETRLWNTFISSSELNEHCMNFSSIGIADPESRYVKLVGHWIFDDGIVSDTAGTILPVTNYSYYKEQLDATGSLFLTSSESNFAYELLPYNYLCPDISLKWNTNKVQYISAPQDYIDKDRISIFSVEFNAVDSLNEDIIKMFSDMNKFSNLIGIPIMKNKSSYDLERYMKELYATRLSKSISFLNYFKNLSWIDKFYFNIIEKLIPARLYFIGEEKVIESHLLERSKVLGQIAKETTCFTGLSSGIGRT
jgi:hypothetical protein